LLLNTPATIFAKLVLRLVLFATSIFAWGTYRRKPLQAVQNVPPSLLIAIQACIAIYGGYFGGGIGGGFAGSWLLTRVPEKLLRGFIVIVGTILTVWLFIR
jgi:uncharacterized protein